MRLLRIFLLLFVFAAGRQSDPDPFEGLWTPVDLEADDEEARVVLEKLLERAGEKFDRLPSCEDRKISVKLKGVPFWRALDEVCRLAGNIRHPDRPFSESTRGVVAAPWIEHPAWYGGPLRLHVYDAARVREFRYPDRVDRTEVTLVLQWSSRVEPTRSIRQSEVGTIRLTRAEDDKGRSLLPLVEVDDSFDHSPDGGINATACPWILKLRPVSPGAKKIAVLEGEWTGSFMTDIEEVSFDKPAECVGASKKVGPMTVTLVDFKQKRHVDDTVIHCSYAIRVSFEPATAGREWMKSLRDVPLGRRVLPTVGVVTRGVRSTDFIWEQEPEEGPPRDDTSTELSGWVWNKTPTSLTFRVAKSVRTVRAKFVLKGVPLPEEEP